MVLRQSNSLTSSISGEVIVTKVEPQAIPSWDHTFTIQVRSVTPDDKVPTIDRTSAVVVTKVKLSPPSYDHDAEVRISRPAQN